jgi:hypothetical protein
VFHLAAAVGVRRIVEEPLQSLRVNLHGTENARPGPPCCSPPPARSTARTPRTR